MESNTTHDKRIKSTQTAFDIIEIIAERDRPSISEIAREIDYSRSTVHYHLKTLQQDRYVIKDDYGYRLGLRMARLGKLSFQKHRLSGIVEKVTEDLATETSAIGHVAVMEGNKLVWLYRSSNKHAEGLPTSVGMETHAHCTGYGQAILAYSADETVDEIVDDYGLPAETTRTLTDRGALDERLATIRDLGFAYSAEEYQEGTSSIAAPIIDESTDEVVGAIGITDSHDQIDNPYKHTKARRFSDELPRLVQQAAWRANNKLIN